MNQSYDAIIVGGGVIGLSCAYFAQKRGLSVCVIERDRPGAGASWQAAGMLAPTTEIDFGEETTFELRARGSVVWPAFADEVGLPYRRTGTLLVALDADEAAELRRLEQLRAKHGLASEWLTPSACRELEPGLGPCAGGAVHPEEAEVDPRAVVQALALRVEIVHGDVVGGVWDGDRLRGVRTSDGVELAAEDVVLASGCWGAAWLPPQAQPPVRPVKGQILRLRGGSVCDRIIGSEWVYVVPRANGEIVVGATVEERGFDTSVTAGAVYELLRDAERLLPDVAELELVEAGAALRPGSPDNAPIVGRGAVDGLILATGHYRNGILLAPLTGEAVASLLAGEEPEGWAAFSSDRFTEVEA
jgi:glycine oxidase